MNILLLTYGNLKFTRLAYNSIPKGHNVFISLGKAGAIDVFNWAKETSKFLIRYDKDVSLAKAINDGFKIINDDFIVMGNDVQLYPETLEILINYYNNNPNVWWINSRELYTPESYCKIFHNERSKFDNNFVLIGKEFDEYLSVPRDLSTNTVSMNNYRIIGDSFNCVLFRKELPLFLIEKDGYFVDESFIGNGYFSDNDLGYRAIKYKIPMVQLLNAPYFHHHSITMKTVRKHNIESHHKDFRHNKKIYIKKWGGLPGEETK